MVQAGTRLGAYEIVAPLGAGGMGEVYRARDTKLGRSVALKILPPSFGADADRIARFEREAQILASLNHPHIAAIYGLDECAGTQFLVLELVSGGTLDARLRAGPVSLPEALTIARQIAEALEAAHERGIIHRDLKPANIALTPDGQVKVLDFGLAKAIEPVPAGDLSHSPTLTFAGTQTGIVLGTAAYMSPEQAKGRVVDKRTDVWAFGCVLYEMLAGRHAFEGEDITDTIAAIVRGEPDWSALPPNVPAPVRLLIERCLEKNRAARVGDIAVARFLLAESSGAFATSPAAGTTRPDARRRRVAIAVIGVAAGALLGGLAVRSVDRRSGQPPSVPIRFSIAPSGGQALAMYGPDRNIDISPDGTLIAYRGADPGQTARARIFVRPLNDLESRPVTEAGDVRAPFFSPDGAWIGYFGAGELRKVPVAGGTPITICHITAAPRGASWGIDDTIVFGTAENTGLMIVPAGGGQPRVLIGADTTKGLDAQPSVLPGGKAILFTMLASPSRTQIAALDLSTHRIVELMTGVSSPRYARGLLWFVSTDGVLHTAPFDVQQLAIRGAAVSVVESVMRTPLNTANYAVSDGGTLVYVPADAQASAVARTPVWVDRRGRETAIDLPSRAYADVRVSPDGERLALGIRDQQNDVWIGDLRRHTLTRLTFDPTVDQLPVWMPDGRRVVWTSQHSDRVPSLYIQTADGTGPPQLLFRNGNPLFPTSATPDGRHLIAWENNPTNAQDLLVIDVPADGTNATATARAVLHSSAAEMDGDISPDGRWLAYQSNESGESEIYVRPFPNVDGGRWQISTAGGTRPAWGRSGREIFYIDPGGLLTSVSVEPRGSTFVPGNPVRVLNTRYYAGTTSLGLDARGYDVAADDQHFVMLKDLAAPGASTPFSMVVTLHAAPALDATAGR